MNKKIIAEILYQEILELVDDGAVLHDLYEKCEQIAKRIERECR